MALVQSNSSTNIMLFKNNFYLDVQKLENAYILKYLGITYFN